jgi:hypothetical protein
MCSAKIERFDGWRNNSVMEIERWCEMKEKKVQLIYNRCLCRFIELQFKTAVSEGKKCAIYYEVKRKGRKFSN